MLSLGNVRTVGNFTVNNAPSAIGVEGGERITTHERMLVAINMLERRVLV